MGGLTLSVLNYQLIDIMLKDCHHACERICDTLACGGGLHNLYTGFLFLLSMYVYVLCGSITVSHVCVGL